MRAALELFEERGYDSTTAAAIAERASVTEMTFFRYFPSKDSVLVADPYDPLIAAAITRQPAELSPLAAAIGAIAGALIHRGAAKTEARIAAAATMAALSAALLDWADGDDPDLGTAIDAALRVLQGDRR